MRLCVRVRVRVRVCVAQATLDTVEAIVVWRDGLTRPAPFLWQGENYLQVLPSGLFSARSGSAGRRVRD